MRALAAAHDTLTQGDWQSADLAALARVQLASYLEGPAPAVSLAGPEVMLPRDIAVPLGLVLHELATNAAKYGALSVPGGSVELTWTVDGESDARHVSLTWRECGGPVITRAPERRGFGSMLIEQGLAEAEIDRQFQADGLLCTIKFKPSASCEEMREKRRFRNAAGASALNAG